MANPIDSQNTGVWNEDGFILGDFNFIPTMEKIADSTARFPSFLLMKDAANVGAYRTNLNSAYDNMIELGIMKGGSCAFFEALLKPRNHLAIDIHRFEHDGLEELTNHVKKQGRSFRADYGTSQDDIPKILELWRSLAGSDQPLDLVVDDASHSYVLSLASFNGLFPLLRPGGMYVLEDWGWAHWGGRWQTREHSEFNKPSLSNLLVHAAFSVTGGSNMIQSVSVTPNAAFILRGNNPSKTFEVERSFLLRDRPLTPF